MEEIKKDYNEKINALEPLSIKRPPKPEPKPEAPKPGLSTYTISFCLLFCLLFANFGKFESFQNYFPIFMKSILPIFQFLESYLPNFHKT